ncbi:MAG: Gfo/Idh/MocA family oxidoreductase [Pseudomonadota bacterium]
MTTDYKPRLRFFADASGQRHIAAEDHYLYRRATPDYRVGIIGTGTIGQEHMRVTRLLGRATIAGIYDASPLSMQVALENDPGGTDTPPVVWQSLADAKAATDVDAWFICTPNDTHHDVLISMMETGKPIFVEKPMATTLADAAAMVLAVEAYPAFVQIGLQYRYKAPYVEARHEAFVRRSLGDIRTVSMCEYRPPFLDKVGQWNKFSERSGGTLVEKCCHYFDLMNLFAGAHATRVYASSGQAHNFVEFEHSGQRSDIDDHAYVVVDYANGVRGNFTLNMFAPMFHEELILTGAGGRLTATERFDFHRQAVAESSVSVECDEPHASRTTVLDYPAVIDQSGHHGATYFEHMAFYDQLDGKAAECATPLEGLWSVIVAAAAQHSSETGAAVDIADFLHQHQLAAVVAPAGES